MFHPLIESIVVVQGYKEYHTDNTVSFEIKLTEAMMAHAEAQGLIKVFKLSTKLSAQNMHLFDANTRIKRLVYCRHSCVRLLTLVPPITAMKVPWISSRITMFSVLSTTSVASVTWLISSLSTMSD